MVYAANKKVHARETRVRREVKDILEVVLRNSEIGEMRNNDGVE